jgi:PAS domain S-box-containing protein
VLPVDLSSDWDSVFVKNPSPMWAFHVHTLCFVDVNEAALAWSGYTRTEFLTLRLHDVHPGEYASQLSALLIEDADPLHAQPIRLGVIPFRKKEGVYAFVRVMCQPVREHTIYVQGTEEKSGSI